jgi:hypothetical protein
MTKASAAEYTPIMDVPPTPPPPAPTPNREQINATKGGVAKAGKTPAEQAGRPLPKPPVKIERRPEGSRITKESVDVSKAIDDSKHSHIVTGKLAPNGRGFSSVKQARIARDKLDAHYGAAAHSYKPNPNFKAPATPEVMKGGERGAMPLSQQAHEATQHANQATTLAHQMTGNSANEHAITAHKMAMRLHHTAADLHEDNGAHQVSAVHHKAANVHEVQISKLRMAKSIEQSDEDIIKSLRWSHKKPGTAATSHGKYHVAAGADGKHTVTYTHKVTGRTETGTYGSEREALGAVTQHHLKNRPAPKPRKKKDPNAPKKLTARAGAPAHCPPCS